MSFYFTIVKYNFLSPGQTWAMRSLMRHGELNQPARRGVFELWQ